MVGGTSPSPSLFLPAFPFLRTGVALCPLRFRKRETGTGTGGAWFRVGVGAVGLRGVLPTISIHSTSNSLLSYLSHDFLGKTSYKAF